MTRPANSKKAETDVFQPDRNCWKVGRAARFGWCIDGEAYFRALHDSILNAQREVLIVGWDIDSRVVLLRGDQSVDHPVELCAFLEHCAEERPELSVNVLSWDFAMIFALERELLPARAFGWRQSDRLHFQLDSKHATGASHHQKLVVIDGALAFCGGLDLTKARWDTREHAADDPRRQDPSGESYGPFHDVQAVVTGDVAGQLRELVSARWANATGENLPDQGGHGDGERLWPANVAVQARDVDVAISRTWTGADGEQEICEIQSLYLDMIGAAKQSIYIENQYFTSAAISEALANSLKKEDGPEILIVLPGETTGWLEQATMDVLRNRAITRLRDADMFERLRIVTPVSDALRGSRINVHAKIMVVDQTVMRIGSANLSRRSMGLDSECDLAIADGPAATAFCADLLAEHLAVEKDAIADSLGTDGLFATVDRFNGQARRFEALQVDVSQVEYELLEPVANIADLEKPITRQLEETETPSVTPAPIAGGLVLMLAGLVIAFWVFLGIQGSGEDFNLQNMLDRLSGIADHPLAPFAAFPAIIVGSLLFAPVTGMIALCALLFDPWTASLIALTGTLGATAVNHWLGSRFHSVLMRRIPNSVTDRISRIASSSDVWTLAGLRLIPIAPFTVVNLVVGASGIRLKPFIIGTLISMTPGIVLICLSVDRARAALAGEPVFDPWILAGIAAAGVAMISLRVWKNRRKQSQSDV